MSTLDFEEIDPYSGVLALTHKDVSLPGNGGLDLNIYRTYRIDRSSVYNALAGRWNIHFGRINHDGSRVAIELQDGTVNSAVRENYNSAFQTFYNYFTKDFWKVNMQNIPSLQLTDGTKIIFGHSLSNGWRYATRIEKNNNVIVIKYDDTTRRIDYVTNSTGRRVDFNYQYIGGLHRLVSITCADDPSHRKLVEYSYGTNGGNLNLLEASYLDGDTWEYNYKVFTKNDNGFLIMSIYLLEKVTTTYGGTITYDYNHFKRADVGTGYKYQLSVSSKDVSGSGVWTYDYGFDDDNNRDYSIIEDPCGRITTYDFYGYSGGYDGSGQSECYQYGLIRHKFTTDNSFEPGERQS